MRGNLANLLTGLRVLVIPIIIACFFLPTPYANWIALGFYVLAGVTDFLDGWVARRMDQHTKLGEFLDPVADKLLVGALLIMLVAECHIAGLTVLPAVVILLREILVSGLREYLADVKVSVPVTQLAKWKTATQIFAIGFLIVGPAGPDFGPLSTSEIGEILLWAAAILTMITGYDYMRAGLPHMRENKGRKKRGTD